MNNDGNEKASWSEIILWLRIVSAMVAILAVGIVSVL